MQVNSFLRKYWAEITLIVITLIGLLLRLYQLGHQGYFSEELSTLNAIQGSYYSLLITPFIHPELGEAPLYYLFAKASAGISIRLPAAIFGTLCIPAIYAFGKEFDGKITGLLAAITIAVSERMVFYSQYGRMYSLVFLFFIFAAYCFLKLQKKESFTKWMLLFVLASALCIWAHFYSAVPLSVLWLILIWQNKKVILPYMVITGACSSIFIIYILGIFKEYLTIPLSANYPPSIYNVTWFENLIRVPYECFGYFGLILIPLFVFYLIRQKNTTAGYFGLTAGLTCLSMLVLTFVFDPSARYAVLIAPLIIVPALVPLSWLISKGKSIGQKSGMFIGIVSIIVLTNVFQLISWFTTNYHFVFV